MASLGHQAVIIMQYDYDQMTSKADCSSLNLDCIPINYPDAIVMDLSHNNISVMEPADFNGTFSMLVELYLDYNDITDVTSLMESTETGSLQKLSLQHNVISELGSICHLSFLTDFSVNHNKLTHLSIPRCGGFKRFSADFNLIRWFDLYDFEHVVSNSIISMQFNQISYIRIEAFTFNRITMKSPISMYMFLE